MEDGESICDREQCRYIGPTPKPTSTAQKMAVSGGVTAFIHIGCFPLLLVFPISFPIMMIVFMARLFNRCPACRRGELYPTESPRGRALKERLGRP